MFRFDQVRPALFLAERFGDDVGPVTKVGQGEWSHAYCFRRGDVDYVVRFGALEEDFAKDRVAVRFDAPDLPVPRVTEIGPAFDGYYAISEQAHGTFLEELDVASFRDTVPGLLATLDALRWTDLTDTAGFGEWDRSGRALHGSWGEYLLDVAEDHSDHRTYGWRRCLATSADAEEAFRAGYEQLRAVVSDRGVQSVGRSLVHGDLINRNVFVTGHRVSSVIDWGCSLYGDFLYDVAWVIFWSPWFAGLGGLDFAAEAQRHYQAAGVEVPDFHLRLRACHLHNSLRHIAYNAFRGGWADLWATVRRMGELSRP